MQRHTDWPRWPSRLILLAALLLALPARAATAPAQESFARPDDAVAALVAATRGHDQKALAAIFGPGSEDIINSGDKYADEQGQDRFAASFDTKHQLVAAGDGRMVLQVGENDWPMPIPLVQQDGRWHFDTQQGAQEIIDRRIGRNELETIRAALAYVQAQHDFFDLTKQQTGTGSYAQRLVSTRGHEDGLYWPARSGEPDSPMGPLVDAALANGYPGELVSGHAIPYQGYLFRILKAQGPNAAEGAKSYTDKGKMTGGFALVAWPASFGVSGIMTFEVNQDGVVYQKDLGPDTAQVVAKITRFDPDPSWAQINLTDN